MPGQHATLSASSAHRWMECTPSALFERQFDEETSSYAEEGTRAHHAAEVCLSLMEAAGTAAVAKVDGDDAEMSDAIGRYVDYAAELINEARAQTPDARVMIEQRLDFSKYVPGGFGTGDLVIIADGRMNIVDLKYGKGVPVSAVGNPQMRLYALGALAQFGNLYDIDRVKMTICQPRLDSVSADEMTVRELMDWAVNVLQPIAEVAAKGEGEYKAGAHCKFCRARCVCRARRDSMLQLAKLEFADPPALSDDEIADTLGQAKLIADWAQDVWEYAEKQSVLSGKQWPGYKLVEGTSRRKYKDQQRVAKILKDAMYDDSEIYKPQELLGITEMTKMLGKKQFDTLLSAELIKPQGKPTLVPEGDKRPAFNSVASAKEDFDDA